VCEYLKGPIESLTGEKVTMCILSNLVDTKITEAKVVMENIDQDLAEKIQEASYFAELDPYRAATNNKGVLKWQIAKLSNSTGDEKHITLYAYNNYFPQIILDDFKRRTGWSVKYDYFSSNEEMLAKILGGAKGYDVIIASDYAITALTQAGALEALDKGRIPNAKNISGRFLNLYFDQENVYSLPYKWGTTGVIYNKSRIKVPLRSWKDIFSGAYANKISLLDDAREALGSQMQALGYSVNSRNKKEIMSAVGKLQKVKNQIQAFLTDTRQHLKQEDIWIAQTFSGDAHQMISEGGAFEYFIPAEGGMLWVDNYVVPKSSDKKVVAFEFLNAMLDVETEVLSVKTLQYNSPLETLNDRSDIPEKLKAKYLDSLKDLPLEYLRDLGADSKLWDDAWTKIKSN
jgi:spermidine/putrescine transport system substrate-binding protein